MARFTIIPQHTRKGKTVREHVRRLAGAKSVNNGLDERISEMRRGKQDTLSFYDGDLERNNLHNEIEDKFFNKDVTKNKVFYMTGGAPANGKSTYLESDVSTIPKTGIIEIDSDRIKGELPEYNRLLEQKNRGAASFVHEESSLLSKKFVARSVEEGNDTLLDGVGNGNYDKFKQKIEGYKKNGHTINANYVSLDTELSVKIARNRAEKTGRYVPIGYVRAMNRDVSKIVPRALQEKLFDKFSLWDTNQQGKPREIIRFANGETKVVSKELWKKFLAKGGARNVSRYGDLFD